MGSSLPAKTQADPLRPGLWELEGGGGRQTPSRQPCILLEGKLRPRQGRASDRGGGAFCNVLSQGQALATVFIVASSASIFSLLPLSAGHEVWEVPVSILAPA